MNLDGTPCGCAWCNPDDATRAELDARWHAARAVRGRTVSVDTYGLVMLQLVMDLFRQRGEGDDDAAARTEGLMATVLSALVRDGETARAASRRDRSGRMN